MVNYIWDEVSKDMVNDFDILLVAKSDLKNDAGPDQSNHYHYHKNLRDQLIELGFNVETTDSLSSFQGLVSDRSFVYGIHSHSWFNGKELFTSAISEFLGVPYLGPRPTVRALTEDKKLSKLLAASLGVKVPEYFEIKNGIVPSNISVNLPWILKPRNGIASQYIFHCDNLSQLIDSLSLIPADILTSTDFIVEEFIPGINITVPIIDKISDSQAELIAFQESDENPFNILTHQGKRGTTKGYSSFKYDGVFLNEIIGHSRLIRESLGEIDYGRLDFRCDTNRGGVYFLEANLICNMSQGSAIGKLAKEYGASYRNLVEHVISISIIRQRR